MKQDPDATYVNDFQTTILTSSSVGLEKFYLAKSFVTRGRGTVSSTHLSSSRIRKLVNRRILRCREF